MADRTKIENRYFRRSANRVGITLEEYLTRIAAGEKWCCGCQLWHSRENFVKDTHTFDGLTAECRAARNRRRPRGPGKRRSTVGFRHSIETRLKMSLARTGLGNANWRGGATAFVKGIRRSPAYYRWRKAVLSRDGACVICQSTSMLCVHHKRPIASRPDLIFAVDNGVTLCEVHHRAAHKVRSDVG